MKICVMHPRIGEQIAAGLRARVSGVEVYTFPDSAREPPGLEDFDVLVANLFPAEMLQHATRLRWLQLTSAGSDQLATGKPRSDLLITHAGNVPARAVAEFVLMALLAVAKQAPALWRQQQTATWQLPLTKLVAGSTLVLVGLGHIGKEIARRATTFDIRVVAVTRRGQPSPLVDRVVPTDQLRTVARDADHLVIAVPGVPETVRLVDSGVISVLPRQAAVINVARASVLDTGALVESLRAGHLRGAVLDVHDEEPLPQTSPMWTVPRLWVTPHCAFSYPGEADDLALLVARNLARLLADQPLINMVRHD
jgi:phosphoglycerate dehydrogenase-like enzyme